MSRFFVGQRVRVKYSFNWPDLAGQEGVVEGPQVITDPNSPFFGKRGWLVAPDCWGTHVAPTAGVDGCGGRFCPIEDQLEPATDCYDTTTWDTCVWQPEHLRVPA